MDTTPDVELNCFHITSVTPNVTNITHTDALHCTDEDCQNNPWDMTDIHIIRPNT